MRDGAGRDAQLAGCTAVTWMIPIGTAGRGKTFEAVNNKRAPGEPIGGLNGRNCCVQTPTIAARDFGGCDLEDGTCA